MTDHPFLRFINLVNFDQKLQSLENQKKTIATEIITINKQEEALVHDLDDMRKRVLQLQKKVDQEELEMKALEQKEKEKRKRLEMLSDYKEYQGIKAEIETIQASQVEQEKLVLDAWHQLENAQATLQKKIIENTNQAQKLHDDLQSLVGKVASFDAEIAHLITERTEKESNIPAEWLEKYIMMRARVADPVVEIFHNSCGACSQLITAQEMVRARHGALVQCQSCYRLLYSPEIMEKHA